MHAHVLCIWAYEVDIPRLQSVLHMVASSATPDYSSMTRTARSASSSSGAAARQTMGRSVLRRPAAGSPEPNPNPNRPQALNPNLGPNLTVSPVLIRWCMTWAAAVAVRTAATRTSCPTSSRWKTSCRRAEGRRGRTRRARRPPPPSAPSASLCPLSSPLLPPSTPTTIIPTPTPTPSPDARGQVLFDALPRLPAHRRKLPPPRTQVRRRCVRYTVRYTVRAVVLETVPDLHPL